jgi:hypothetical protein
VQERARERKRANELEEREEEEKFLRNSMIL